MLNSIQILRAIAAFMVLGAHMPKWAFPSGTRLDCEPSGFCGSIGVDLFFCISGFLMFATTVKSTSGLRCALAFFTRRLFRIWPLYIIATLLYNRLLGRYYINDIHSFFFLPSYPPPNFNYSDPDLSPGWSLNYEMFFYVLVTVFLLSPLKTKGAGIAVVILGLGSLAFGEPYFFTGSIIVEFAFGIGIAMLWRNYSVWIILHKARWIILTVTPFLLFVLANARDIGGPLGATPRMVVTLYYFDVVVPRFLAWGLPMALLTICALLFEEKIPRYVARLGDYTYSIYILHLPIMTAGYYLTRHLPAETLDYLIELHVIVFGIIGTILLMSWASYYLIERPAQRVGSILARRIEGKFPPEKLAIASRDQTN